MLRFGDDRGLAWFSHGNLPGVNRKFSTAYVYTSNVSNFIHPFHDRRLHGPRRWAPSRTDYA
jgi:hypothetical protein